MRSQVSLSYGAFKQPTKQRSTPAFENRLALPKFSEALKQWKTKGKKIFPRLNMRESLTPDQLLRRKQLIDECRKKRADDPEHD